MFIHVERGLNIRIIDSLNFLPMRLAALPKAFGLDEMKKGYFPHFMNTAENQYYLGPYPSPEMYGVNTMSTKDRDEFFKWYTTVQGEFNFRNEMFAYCVSDVDILRRACLKFRNLLFSSTANKISEVDGEVHAARFENGADPFSFTTIASVCMGIFRQLHLEETYQVKLKQVASNAAADDWLEGKAMGNQIWLKKSTG